MVWGWAMSGGRRCCCYTWRQKSKGNSIWLLSELALVIREIFTTWSENEMSLVRQWCTKMDLYTMYHAQLWSERDRNWKFEMSLESKWRTKMDLYNLWACKTHSTYVNVSCKWSKKSYKPHKLASCKIKP